MNVYFPAEWHPQDAILMSWPHSGTDWSYMLDTVEKCYKEIISVITRYEEVIVVSPNPDDMERVIGKNDRVRHVTMPTNDTWARDFGPITVLRDGELQMLDFTFNAWGMKFAACHDNAVNRHLQEAGVLRVPLLNMRRMVLEGGSIESDGNGTVMTTAQCLLESNRNPWLTQGEIEQQLKELLGAQQVVWLHHGALIGDDTDSHIDTLARFAPNGVILYTYCDNPNDEHHASLKLMETEILAMRDTQGTPYRTMRLPLPMVVNNEGERLPATYANFLVINDAVLVPTYNLPDSDSQALSTIASAFPGRDVIGIDCTALIHEHGSLHCATMQLPQNTLKR